jgi:hypothetical protein
VHDNWADDAGRAVALPHVRAEFVKSRIACQVRMRFAGIDRPRSDHLVANLVLTRPVRNERFVRVDYVPPYYNVHRVRLLRPEDVDAELRSWLAEA